jgi:hypothetical protein
MKRDYFSITAILLLLLSLFGFSDNLFTNVTQKSNSDPKFIIHGLFWLLWMTFFLVQASLIRVKNIRTHMRLGVVGMLIAIGVVVSTFFVFFAVFKGWDLMPSYVKANRFNMVAFTVLIYLAYRYKKRPVWHKRFILVGTLLIQEPILSRVSDKLGIDPLVGIMVIVNIFFLSLFVYDWSVLKRIHPISYIGFIWMYLVQGIAEIV